MSKARTSTARLDSLGNGHFRVAGVLDADTVTEILAQSSRKFAGVPSVIVDLSLVTSSDSAGLALLIEWLRLTRVAGSKIHFDNVPQQIMALARISEIDDLLLENGTADPAQDANQAATATA
ncbi:STAS domain-containing protein [Povalibacter sp.]|uniref:STAS domain-containing protein n=1 Tax=Povalibacter sp. TaxID=1962978 RepID=UPI002F41DB89